jgi:UDP-N-acetylmuramyl pentapeptide phosphotransferase/UDP-N-acetylglucosamine-1-phosphate transferase
LTTFGLDGARLLGILAVTLIVAVAFGGLLLLTSGWHMRWTADHPDSGPQKVHAQPTIRVGGLAWVAGVLAGLLALACFSDSTLTFRYPASWLMAGAFMLLLVGLLEDVSGTVSVRARLGVTLVVGAVMWAGAGLQVTRADFPPLDFLLSLWPVSMVFTMIALAGLVHAMNIVDGLNGLLAGINMVVMAAIAVVAFRSGLFPIVQIALVVMVATFGFALFNFPKARMFCGDAGAYVMGYVAAVLLVALMEQTVVSPWFGLAVVMHPVVETLYSAWRRSRRGSRAMLPDARHMHSLWMDRLRHSDRPVWFGANAGASLRTMGMAAMPALLATLWPNSRWALMLICLGYVVVFVWVVRLLDAQHLERHSVLSEMSDNPASMPPESGT